MGTLQGAGAQIVKVALPYYNEITAAAVVSIVAEALAYHAPDIRSRWLDYFASTRVGLGYGALVSGPDYIQAQRVRAAGQKAISSMFHEVDLIVTPTVSRPAPSLEAAADYTATLFEGNDFSYHTAYWNSLGNPALTVPIGFGSGGLPLGAQIIGRHFDEATVLRAGEVYQTATSWHLQLPASFEKRTSGECTAGTRPDEASVEHAQTVAAMLRIARLTVPADECAILAAALPMVRHNADLLYTVPEARYEQPYVLP
jgi:aspartyl-tRNA(Asn)/glutamyl-tRNA(Gln) amidotransferase subunit A